LLDGRLAVEASDLTAFARGLAPIARDAGIRLHELTATDDTLESVFSYLVRR
jgi:ABC-2 type transport system ATP-binding protein